MEIMENGVESPALWPQEYVSLDSGRLLVHPAYVDYRHLRGWDTAVDLLRASGEADVVRRRCTPQGWDNAVWRRPDFPHVPVMFVKRHRGALSPLSPAKREARAIGWCQELQIPCMDMMAVGEIPEGVADDLEWPCTSFIITPLVGEGISAMDMLEARDAYQLSDEDVRRILRLIILNVARLHSENYFHGDCHFRHFLHESDGQSFVLKMIDLQSVRPESGLRAFSRWMKDMGGLRTDLLLTNTFIPHSKEFYSLYCENLKSLQIQRWIRYGALWAMAARCDFRWLRSLFLAAVKLNFRKFHLLYRRRIGSFLSR